MFIFVNSVTNERSNFNENEDLGQKKWSKILVFFKISKMSRI